MLAETLFIYSSTLLSQNFIHGINNLFSSAVSQSKINNVFLVVFSFLHQLFYFLLHSLRKQLNSADKIDLNSISPNTLIVNESFKFHFKQLHQVVYFHLRTLKILHRESVQSQFFNLQINHPCKQAFYCSGAHLMAFPGLLELLFSQSSVSVQDYA